MKATASELVTECDALTGLANRRGFIRAVTALIDEHPDTSFVLVYGDIDRFKVFNDRFGTDAGDRLLAGVGAMMERMLPAPSVAARVRADHFARSSRPHCLPVRVRSSSREAVSASSKNIS